MPGFCSEQSHSTGVHGELGARKPTIQVSGGDRIQGASDRRKEAESRYGEGQGPAALDGELGAYHAVPLGVHPQQPELGAAWGLKEKLRAVGAVPETDEGVKYTGREGNR